MKIEYAPRGTGFRATLRDDGPNLLVCGVTAEHEPEVAGDPKYVANSALVAALTAFGEHERQRRRSKAIEKKLSHEKAAKFCRREALHIGYLVAKGTLKEEQCWCSACFKRTTHGQVVGTLPSRFLCLSCGSSNVWCSVPTCRHMAVLRPSNVSALAYCAAHRHEITNFAKLETRLATLDDANHWLVFDHLNAKRYTTVTVGMIGAAVVMAPAAFLAAPAIGAAVGTIASGGALSGAAATSSGLALLGGGSVAVGGAGMAGGAMVVSATGAALGGVLGAATTAAYVGTDKSFRIQKLRDGLGAPVVVASGFLTQGDDGWGGWHDLVDMRYPDSPVYRVHWGSKELKSWGVFAGIGGGKAIAGAGLIKLAKNGMKKVPILPGLTVALAAQSVLANPWHVARARAQMTGVVLADLIARSDEGPYVLVGHSLGARVMIHAAQALGTRTGAPKIAELHLLGAAIGAKGDWQSMHTAVEGSIYNYWSANDGVLKYVYGTIELGEKAAGLVGFNSKWPRLKDRNVTRKVPGHLKYHENIRLL